MQSNLQKSAPTEEKQSRRHVIIAGYYGFDNLGDEAILEELLNELNELGLKQDVVVLSNNPAKTTALYQVKSINRWHWFGYIDLLKTTKLLISGGGGLFQDRTGFGSVIFYSLQIFLARLYGAAVLIYAQGVGPLNTIFGQTLTRLAFSKADKITVRDTNSLSTVTNWGLDAQLSADPVWSLSPSSMPAPAIEVLKTIKNQLPKSPDAKGIVIGLSLRDDPLLEPYHLDLLAQSLMDCAPATILFLPFQEERDEEPLRHIEQLLSKSDLCLHYLNSDIFSKPSQWLSLIENCDILIGMRFHALLFSLKNGKPVIGIAYDQKVSHLLKTFEQPALSLELGESESEITWTTTIAHALETRENLSASIKNKVEIAKQMANKNNLALTNLLEVGTAGNATSNYR